MARSLLDDLDWTTVGIGAAVGGVVAYLFWLGREQPTDEDEGYVFQDPGATPTPAPAPGGTPAHPGAPGTPAPAAKRALADASARWPGRNRASDGIMGDAAHQARKSDHNLGNAVDITHDPASGCDAQLLADAAIQDPRVTYVIWNRQIYNRSMSGGGWRQYSGPNPHTHHVHISIREDSRDDVRPWAWAPGGTV